MNTKNNTFIENAKLKHGDKYDYSKVNYITAKTKVDIICPVHGLFKQIPNSHLSGSGCPICVGNQKLTTETFIERANKIHNNQYDYSLAEYVGIHSNVKIICPVHGLFEQQANSHLKGANCPVCTNHVPLTTETFIERANKIHNNQYDYSLAEYGYRDIIKIICPVHGLFKQQAYSHLSGRGCYKCRNQKISKSQKDNQSGGWSTNLWETAANKSKNFDSFKVYIIECWNDTERFYKIGKTFKSVKARFKSKSEMPYNYKVLNEYIGNCKEICKLEQDLKNKHKEHSYTPKNEFNGMYECFNKLLQIRL